MTIPKHLRDGLDARLPQTCDCHKFIRLHDWTCAVHGFVRKEHSIAPESGNEWRYVENKYSAEVVAGQFILRPHWLGVVSPEEIRATMRRIVSDHALAALASELAEALSEMLNSGVEFNDERLGYLSIQVERETWKQAQAALANAASKSNGRGESGEAGEGVGHET